MADISIWNQCNNHCIMCTNPIDFHLENSNAYTFENIKNRWKDYKFQPNEPIGFTGGEPTSHPDFFKIVRWFHTQFPKNKIVVVSNGRMFFYKSFAKNLLKINNLYIEIAIHGFDEISHDQVTRVRGSFEQTIKGIHNILRYKNDFQEFEIRIVITKITYKNLDKILTFVNNEFDISQIRDIVLIFMEMEGQAETNQKFVGVTYKEIMKYIPQIMTKWSPIINDLRLYHFPLCVLPPKLWKYSWRTLREEEIMFVPRCQKCFLKKLCLGIHRDYFKLIGDKEFNPPNKIKLETSDNIHKPINKVFN